jgi:hypothetical protein
MVEVVAGADDLAVAHPEHEDAGQDERLSGAGDGAPVLELGDDHLRIGRLVDDDVGRAAVQSRTGVGRTEVFAQFVAAAQGGAAKRIERVHHVRLFRVEVGKLLPPPGRDAVDERMEDVTRVAGSGHAMLLSSADPSVDG